MKIRYYNALKEKKKKESLWSYIVRRIITKQSACIGGGGR